MSSEPNQPGDPSATTGVPLGSGAVVRKPSSQRRLIEAAMGQLDERSHAIAVDDTPPPDAFPGYEIIKEVHRGGQGVVYQAIQKATKRRVALKVLHEGPFAGTIGRSRFEREVQVLGQLNHPNIVRIHDSGVSTTGHFYYVMDYISGKPLDEFIRTRDDDPAAAVDSGSKRDAKRAKKSRGTTTSGARVGPLTVEDTLRVFVKVCDGVNAAHLRGVIHRDLKPSNVRVDQNGEPIVVDFGLAKTAAPDLDHDSGRPMTITGQFIGSLPWASPEQAEGSPDGIDVRTDVYSLGVMLYQMLTGKFPYQVTGSMRDVMENILHAEPARPSTVRKQIGDEVETIVLKCLHKDKDRRYQSAGELARDLQRYLRGEPIEAKRDSALYLIGKALRRYRVQTGVAAAFAGMVVLFAAFAAVMLAQTRAAWQEEKSQRQVAERATLQAQAQRDRAERNFQAVRAMSRTFLFEFNAAVEGLRGATAAREQLVRTAVTSLDGLAAQAGDDPTLLRELADGYEQLGRIEGGLFEPRVGTKLRAAERFAKAKEIREALLKRLPGEARSHADMGASLKREGNILELDRKYEDAQRRYEEAMLAYERAMQLAEQPDNPDPALRQIAEHEGWELVRLVGDTFARRAVSEPDRAKADDLFARAEAQYTRALNGYFDPRAAARPGDAGARSDAEVLRSKLASNLRARASALTTRAEREIKQSPPQDQAAGPVAGSRLTPKAAAMLGEALDRLAQAEPIATAARDAFAAIAAAHPQSAVAARDLYIAEHGLGWVWSARAAVWQTLDQDAGVSDPRAVAPGVPEGATVRTLEAAARGVAMERYRAGLAIAARLAADDPKNIEAQRELAVCLNKIGNEWRWGSRLSADAAERARMLDEAERAYAESLRLRRELLASDPMQRHIRDVGLALFKLAQVNLERAASPGTPDDTRAALRSVALGLLRGTPQEMGAMQAWMMLVNDQVLAPEAQEILETREAIREAEGRR